MKRTPSTRSSTPSMSPARLPRRRSIVHWLVVSAAALVGIGAAPTATHADSDSEDPLGPVLTLADLLDTVSYRVKTTLGPPGTQQVVRETPGLVGVPTLVDVDKPKLLGLPDVVVLVTPRLPLGLGVTVLRSPLATPRPIAVEVELDIPASDLTAVFGYDATTSTNPAAFDAAVSVGLGADRAELGLDANVSGAGSTLDLVGSVFTEINGTQLDPKTVRLSTAPVPPNVGVQATLTPGFADRATAPHREMNVVADVSSTTHAVIDANLTTGDMTQDVHVDIPELPTQIDVTHVADDPTGTNTITYNAATPIPNVVANIDELEDGEVVSSADVTVDGLPTQAELNVARSVVALEDTGEPATRDKVTWSANDDVDHVHALVDRVGTDGTPLRFEGDVLGLPRDLDVTLDRVGAEPAPGVKDERPMIVDVLTPAEQSIGTVEAGFASGGTSVPFLDPLEPTYVNNISDADGGRRAAVQLVGLEHARIDTREPLVIEVDSLAANKMNVHHATPGKTIDAIVADLPSTARLSLLPADPEAAVQETVISYEGSTTVGRLDATTESTDADDDTTSATIELKGLPTAVDATVIERPNTGDTEVHYLGAGRISRITADVTTTPDGDDVDDGTPTHLIADVRGVPDRLDVSLDTAVAEDATDETHVVYDASGALNRLDATMDGVTGFSRLALVNLPSHVELCSAKPTGTCTDLRDGTRVVGGEVIPFHGRDGFSMQVAANGALTVEEVFQCASGCTGEQDDEQFTHITDFALPTPAEGTFSKLGADAFPANPDNGITTDHPDEIGLVFLDSDDKTVRIDQLRIQSINQQVDCPNDIDKPTVMGANDFGFSAANRLVLYRVESRTDDCAPTGMDRKFHEGEMECEDGGEFFASAKNPKLSSLRQEFCT